MSRSFERVGSDYPVEENRLQLRKWSGASSTYKRKFIDHAEILKQSGNVLLGADVSNDRAIRRTGEAYWRRLVGDFPKPSSFNKKGRPRLLLGGYKVDGRETKPYEVLQDDLLVLGWYAEALAGALKALAARGESPVS